MNPELNSATLVHPNHLFFFVNLYYSILIQQLFAINGTIKPINYRQRIEMVSSFNFKLTRTHPFQRTFVRIWW